MHYSLSSAAKNLVYMGATMALVVAFLLSFSSRDIIIDVPDQSVHEGPEIIVFNSLTREYDEQGSLEFEVSSDETLHYPSRRTTELSQPKIRVYEQGTLTWSISSDNGFVYEDGQKVELEQRVVASSSDGKTLFKTPMLRIYPQQRIAENDKPVTMVSPNGFARAIGMRADMKTGTLILKEAVTGQYHVNATP